jgi:hypothetical protein
MSDETVSDATVSVEVMVPIQSAYPKGVVLSTQNGCFAKRVGDAVGARTGILTSYGQVYPIRRTITHTRNTT